MSGNRVSDERLKRTFTKESEVPDEVMLMPVYFDAAGPLDSICVGDILRELARLRPVVEAAKVVQRGTCRLFGHPRSLCPECGCWGSHLQSCAFGEALREMGRALAALGGSDA